MVSSFRLLNSEIGNDLKDTGIIEQRTVGFRLLNSEIGNDHVVGNVLIVPLTIGFRLLNSEIGNDLTCER